MPPKGKSDKVKKVVKQEKRDEEEEEEETSKPVASSSKVKKEPTKKEKATTKKEQPKTEVKKEPKKEKKTKGEKIEKIQKSRKSAGNTNLSDATIMRLASKAGCTRVSSKVYDIAREIFKKTLDEYLFRVCLYTQSAKRITIRAKDVEIAIPHYKLYPNAKDIEEMNKTAKESGETDEYQYVESAEQDEDHEISEDE
ncbi:hypothetical protein ABK040_004113 [Willaertia magna]